MEKRWRMWFTSRTAAQRAGPETRNWLDEVDMPERQPFLIGPDGTFDIELHFFFGDFPFIRFSSDTQEAMARDMVRFFDFLYRARRHSITNKTRGWRDVIPDDRAAYFKWRNVDPKGPRVAASTWNREVATLNTFYQWAERHEFVEQSPIRLRDDRKWVKSSSWSAVHDNPAPAELRPDENRGSLRWLPADNYLLWRDVGLRGFLPNGGRDLHFKGVMSGRNSVFADLMMRTGLRLREQASLLLTDIPARSAGKRFAKNWIPEAIAKGSSARDIYYPDQILGSLEAYRRVERNISVREGQRSGIYEKIYGKMILEKSGTHATDENGHRFDVRSLDSRERAVLYRMTDSGLEPMSLWLSQTGVPLSSRSWQNIFETANKRCLRHGVQIRCHPHALRHTYAVRTLDQLQRGNIEALAQKNPAQRRHYMMIFGDPLDWVRRRLGHASIETTMKYLHTLAELEFETKMTLVGTDEEWGAPDELGRLSPVAGS